MRGGETSQDRILWMEAASESTLGADEDVSVHGDTSADPACPGANAHVLTEELMVLEGGVGCYMEWGRAEKWFHRVLSAMTSDGAGEADVSTRN